MTEHRWPLDRYWIDFVVSAINVTGLNDFRTISFETLRMPTRSFGVLWFWDGEPVHGNLPNADAVGYFRPGTLHGFMRPDLFESVYAILRSERPVMLHFDEQDGTVVSLELIAVEEPVGEVDRSWPLPHFGFAGLVDELEAVATNSG